MVRFPTLTLNAWGTAPAGMADTLPWLASLPAQPVIGVVVGPSVAQALGIRRALFRLQQARPDADWVLLGPKPLFCLFEMDTVASAHIPLLAANPLRKGQPRLGHWWQVRRQHRKLAQLPWQALLAPASDSAAGGFGQAPDWVPGLLKALRPVPVVDCPFFNDGPAPPLLQAGVSALAWATRLMRQANPRDLKVLTVWPTLNNMLQAHTHGAALGPQAGVLTVHAVWRDTQQPLLQARQAKAVAQQTGVACELVDLPQVLGLLAYADRVNAHCPVIPRICLEMGRQDRVVLA